MNARIRSKQKLRDRLLKSKRKSPAQKRIELRDSLWPGSDKLIWDRHNNKGFGTIPRLLPLILQLIKKLSDKGDSSMVYFELWARNMDEGIISKIDSDECAYASGYNGARAVRTWRDHIFQLESLGFIKTKQAGNKEYAHILIINPLLVCQQLRNKNKVPEEWWTAYVQRASEIGAKLPEA